MRSRTGFTLIELLLVTIIIGLLASIVSPTFQRARERALVSAMKSDARNLITATEIHVTLNNGAWPSNIDDLKDDGGYTQTEGLEICYYVAVPSTPWRDGHFYALIGHPGTTMKVFVIYPLWRHSIWDYDNGRLGCG
jgi:general secretion pathway protein G